MFFALTLRADYSVFYRFAFQIRLFRFATVVPRNSELKRVATHLTVTQNHEGLVQPFFIISSTYSTVHTFIFFICVCVISHCARSSSEQQFLTLVF
jgi:hypothetical protein